MHTDSLPITATAFADTIADPTELRTLYRRPGELVSKKKIDHIDTLTRQFIEASPFVLIATADRDGRCSVSPRGGEPGFVKVLDEHRFAIPDAVGNNLIETLQNIVDNPFAGLLFVLPGEGVTLRVDGEARLTRDPGVLAAVAAGGKRPKLAIGIRVHSAYSHCSRSFDRGRVWDPASWSELTPPSMLELYRGHLASNGVTLPTSPDNDTDDT